MWNKIFSSTTSQRYAQHVQEHNSLCNGFVEWDPRRIAPKDVQSPLAGLPFAVKDNIAVKDFHLTCGSALLKDFLSPYHATSVQRLLDAGAWMVGKTNLDEFGMGSDTHASIFGRSNNPWDHRRTPGGSSGGSAAVVAQGFVPFALGSDTGGSVRQPAAFCGIWGLKPTYGRISRYGLVAFASSLDTVGILAENIDTLQEVFHCIAAFDEKDQSSVHAQETDPQVKTIGFINVSKLVDAAVARGYERAKKSFQSLGYELKELKLPFLDYAVATYYIIAAAEASANLSRYDGIRYGNRDDSMNIDQLVRNTRSKGFGLEVRLRVLAGTYALRSGFYDQYYGKAQSVRAKIRREMSEVFKEVDVLLSPIYPTPAFFHSETGDTYEQKISDYFSTPANLSGVPALSVPLSVEDALPVGVQLMAPAFCEQRLFSVARRLKLPRLTPPGYVPVTGMMQDLP